MVAQLDQLRRLQIPRPELREKKPSKYSKHVWALVVVVIILFVVVALWRWLAAPPAIAVEAGTARIETQDTPGLVLSASGYIVAHHRIDVNSKVTGRVAWIGVEKGDHVREGQVLVRLEDQEFRAQVQQAQGEVAGAQAQLHAMLAGARPEEIQRDLNNLREAEVVLENDRVLLNRNEGLYAAGVISKQQLDETKAHMRASEQHVEALRQTHKLASLGPRQEEIEKSRGDLEQAMGKLAFSRSQLEATQIRAPVAGTILERTAEKGELVTAQFASAADTGGPRGSVVALADLSDLQVEADISQDDFAKLADVTRASVSTDAYPDKQYDGRIAQVSPEANRQKATVQVRIQILQADRFLRPDMNANVEFYSDRKSPTNVVSVEVPFSSVITREQKRVVMLIIDGRAAQKPVHVIGRRTTGYLVEGIRDGDRLVIDPPGNLKDGDRVKINAH